MFVCGKCQVLNLAIGHHSPVIWVTHVCACLHVHTHPEPKYNSQVTMIIRIQYMYNITQIQYNKVWVIRVWVVPVGCLRQTVASFLSEVLSLLLKTQLDSTLTAFFAVRWLVYHEWESPVSGLRFLRSGFSFSTLWCSVCWLNTGDSMVLAESWAYDREIMGPWTSCGRPATSLYHLFWTLREQVIYLWCLTHNTLWGLFIVVVRVTCTNAL